MGNIPKIKPEERVKLIDIPELVVVHPLTHAASIRYGHKSDWCTSTSNKNEFQRHSRNGMLLYVLMFDTEDGKRKGDAKTKMALYRRYRQTKRPKWDAYDLDDAGFNFDIISWMLQEKYQFSDIIDKYYNSHKKNLQKRKLIPNDNKIGDIIEGKREKLIKLTVGEWKSRTRSYYNRRQGRWIRKKLDFPPQECAMFEVCQQDIKSAEVYGLTAHTIKIKILELRNPTPFAKFMLKNYELTTSLRMAQDPNFEVIGSNAAGPPKATKRNEKAGVKSK